MLATPLGAAAFSTFAVALAFSLCGLLFVGTYTPKETVRGYVTVEHGGVLVYPQSDGRIVSLNVAESDTVAAGQVLMTVSSARATGQTDTARALVVAELQAQHRQQQLALEREQAMFTSQTQNLKDDIASTQATIVLLGKQREKLEAGHQLAETRVARLSEPALRPFVSDQEREAATAAVVEYEFRLQTLAIETQRVRIAARQKRQALHDIPIHRDIRTAAIHAVMHQIAREIAENEDRVAQAITAPSAGVISGLLVQTDQTVAASQPLLSIVADQNRYDAELLIPPRSIGFVKKGDTARLRLDTFPYQKFGGRSGTITELSRTTVQPGDKRFGIPIAEPMYIARVRLDEDGQSSHELQAGMTLTADLLRHRRRLIEWLIEPLMRATQN